MKVIVHFRRHENCTSSPSPPVGRGNIELGDYNTILKHNKERKRNEDTDYAKIK